VSVQQVIDRAVTDRLPDRFLVGRLEIVYVQHLASAGRFGETRKQGLLSAIRFQDPRVRLEPLAGEMSMVTGSK
jgi:hypothetical protein